MQIRVCCAVLVVGCLVITERMAAGQGGVAFIYAGQEPIAPISSQAMQRAWSGVSETEREAAHGAAATILAGPSAAGREDSLTTTREIQIALALHYGVLTREATRLFGDEVIAAGGSSAGEAFAAAFFCADRGSLESVLRFFEVRGRLAQELSERLNAGMGTVEGEHDRLEELCRRVTESAQGDPGYRIDVGIQGYKPSRRDERPTPFAVLSGAAAAFEQLERDFGVRAEPIKPRTPFHSPLLRPVAEHGEFRAAVQAFGAPRLTLVSGLDSGPYTELNVRAKQQELLARPGFDLGRLVEGLVQHEIERVLVFGRPLKLNEPSKKEIALLRPLRATAAHLGQRQLQFTGVRTIDDIIRVAERGRQRSP